MSTDGQAERQTDMTKILVTFRNFPKTPKKQQIHFLPRCCHILATASLCQQIPRIRPFVLLAAASNNNIYNMYNTYKQSVLHREHCASNSKANQWTLHRAKSVSCKHHVKPTNTPRGQKDEERKCRIQLYLLRQQPCMTALYLVTRTASVSRLQLRYPYTSFPLPAVPLFRRVLSLSCSQNATSKYRYASLNDGDTFWEMRRCANVMQCTYTNLDSTV
jgi:hypothetical protein